jgi:putative tryptophan/tyrosine transport system substrate-binding protein
MMATLVLAVLAAPVAAEAQPAAKAVPRIGFLGNLDAKNQGRNVAAFQEGLRDLGWIEGQTVMVDYRWAEGNADRLPGLVAELVQLNVNVMVVAGPPAVRAAQRATSTIPIVFAVVLNDPVASGFAASFARPGGNITGLASQYEEIVGKHVQLLSEAIPRLSRMILLRHTAGLPILLTEAEKAARRLGIKARIVEVTEVAEYEDAFRIAKGERAQAVYVLPSPIFNAHRKRLVELAAQYHLPAAYELKEYVEAGGLLSYGPNTADMYRRAASYVDRILKGAKPGDLPIERAATFELAINVKTAKALGLAIPQSLLARADHLIE